MSYRCNRSEGGRAKTPEQGKDAVDVLDPKVWFDSGKDTDSVGVSP